MNDVASTRTPWWQSIYGKIAPVPDGPIITGSEHRCTGRSEGLPAEIAKHCFPHIIGIGMSDQSNWSNYRWKSGGLTVRPLQVNGNWYVIAARIRGRSEAGEGKTGRLYTQAHYLVAAAAEVPKISLLDLPSALKADPMRQISMELESKQVALLPNAEVQLPANWFDKVTNYLRPILAGQCVAVQDWEINPDDFYRHAMLCLACLPAPIRCHIPIGCGMCEIDGVGLGHGMRAQGGVRLISGQWRGLVEIPQQAVRKVNLYLDWLREIMDDGSLSPLALCQRVDETFGEIGEKIRDSCYGGDKPTGNWETAVSALLDYIAERRPILLLNRYLQGECDVLDFPVDSITNCQAEAIRAIVESLPIQHCADRVNESLAATFDWKWAWKTVSSSEDRMCSAIAMLLGYVSFDVGMIIPALEFELPSRFAHQAQRTLRENLIHDSQNTKSILPWAELVRRLCGLQLPKWVMQWSRENETELEWTFFRLFVEGVQDSSIIAQCKFSDVRSKFLQRARLTRDDLADFMTLVKRSYRDGQLEGSVSMLAARAAVGFAFRADLHTEGLLLNRELDIVERKNTGYVPLNTKPEERSSRERIVNDVTLRFKEFDKDDFLLEVILYCWESINEIWKRQHQVNIAYQIGDSMSKLLLDDGVYGGMGPKDKESVANAALPTAMTISDKVLARVQRQLLQKTNTKLHEITSRWVKSVDRQRLNGPGFKELAFLKDVKDEQSFSSLLPLNLDQALTICHVRGDRVPFVPRRINEVGELYAVAALADTNSCRRTLVPPNVFAAAIENAIQNPRWRTEFWQPVLLELGLNNEKCWRTLLQTKECPKLTIDPDEEPICQHLGARTLIELLLSNCRLSRAAAQSVERKLTFQSFVASPPLSLECVDELVKLAQESELPIMAKELWCFVVLIAHANFKMDAEIIAKAMTRRSFNIPFINNSNERKIGNLLQISFTTWRDNTPTYEIALSIVKTCLQSLPKGSPLPPPSVRGN